MMLVLVFLMLLKVEKKWKFLKIRLKVGSTYSAFAKDYGLGKGEVVCNL